MKSAGTALLLLACGSAAWAHDEKFSVSRIDIKDDGVTWSVDVSLQGLEKVLQLPADPVDLSDSQFQGMKASIVKYLGTCMKVEINGVLVEPEAGTLAPLFERHVASGEMVIAHARQDFRFPSTKPVRNVVLNGAFFATKTDRHHAVLNVAWNGARRSFSRYGPFELDLTPSRVQPTFATGNSETGRSPDPIHSYAPSSVRDGGIISRPPSVRMSIGIPLMRT